MTYITTHEELLKLYGRKVKCKIDGEVIDDAKICVEDGEVFICQNEVKGTSCENKLGYIFSWSISETDYKYEEKEYLSCTEIELTDEPQDKIEKLEKRLKVLTPAIINDAEETWQEFTDVWNGLYTKAEKIKTKP